MSAEERSSISNSPLIQARARIQEQETEAMAEGRALATLLRECYYTHGVNAKLHCQDLALTYANFIKKYNHAQNPPSAAASETD